MFKLKRGRTSQPLHHRKLQTWNFESLEPDHEFSLNIVSNKRYQFDQILIMQNCVPMYGNTQSFPNF